MSAGFNFEPGDRVLIEGEELRMHRMVPATRDGDPDDIQFENRSGRIFTYTQADFLELYNAEKFRRLGHTERISDHPPEEEKDATQARRRLAYCKAFDADPVSKSEEPLRRFIEEFAASVGDLTPPSTGSLRKWLRERGEPGNRKLREMTDRYRAKKGSRLHPFVEEALACELERYWDSSRVTAKEVWARVVTKIDDRNALLSLSTEHRIPTISSSTVWRRCQSEITYERARRRYGAKEAARRFQALRGSMEAECLLDSAIMDHTELDCWVVDDVTLQPIGRPRVTLLMDSCSRYLLGYHIGWKSASVEAAMACLRHALPKKTDIRERYPEVQHEWLGYGQPREIVVDQGLEFVGSTFEDACSDLGISIRFAPVRTPEFKGQIERLFGTFNTQLVHRLPGSVPGKPNELRALGIDPEKDAVLLLSDLDLLITKWAVDVYAREVHRELNASPAQVWLKRLKTDGVELCPDLAALNAACSKTVKRTLTREGIELNNLTYRSEAVSGLLLDLLPRARKRNANPYSVQVKVKYHPENLGRIWVWNEATGEYVDLPCTKPDYAEGLSEHHHGKLREWAKKSNREFTTEAEMCRARVELYDLMETLAADKVRDRKRLQRSRDPERELQADRVRLSSVDPREGASPREVNALEVLIDPVRNRTDGDRLHSRPLLRKNSKKDKRRTSTLAPPAPRTVVDVRSDGRAPLEALEFAEAIREAREETGRGG